MSWILLLLKVSVAVKEYRCYASIPAGKTIAFTDIYNKFLLIQNWDLFVLYVLVSGFMVSLQFMGWSDESFEQKDNTIFINCFCIWEHLFFILRNNLPVVSTSFLVCITSFFHNFMTFYKMSSQRWEVNRRLKLESLEKEVRRELRMERRKLPLSQKTMVRPHKMSKKSANQLDGQVKRLNHIPSLVEDEKISGVHTMSWNLWSWSKMSLIIYVGNVSGSGLHLLYILGHIFISRQGLFTFILRIRCHITLFRFVS